MITICPTCTPVQKEAKVAPRKIKSLVYVNIKSNAAELVEEMAEKDPRPNFHLEMGYSDAPDSPDRFDADNYDDLIRQIEEFPLDLPPEIPYDEELFF